MTQVTGAQGTGVTPVAPVALTTNLLPPPVLPVEQRITNRLTEEQQTISGVVTSTTFVSGWLALDGCTLGRSTVYYKYDPASLEVTVDSPGTAVIATDGYVDPVTPGATYRAFAWIRTNAMRRPVRIGIEWYSRSGTSQWDVATQSTETLIGAADGWALVSHEGIAPDTSGFVAAKARIRVLLPDAGPIDDPINPEQRIWIDDAVFTEQPKYRLPFTRTVYRWLPEYMRLLDAEQTNPTEPLARYLDLVCASATRILDATFAFDYIPPEDGVIGYARSTLLDPYFYPRADIAEERWLSWLSFISGTTPFVTTSLVTGLRTPWYVLEDLSPPTTTWDDVEGFGSAPPTWNELEAYAPMPVNSVVSVQDSIRLRGTGTLAGTTEGIRRAARLILSSDDAFDEPAIVVRVGGVVTATFERALTISPGDDVEIYDSGVIGLDGISSVTAVSSDRKTISFTLAGGDLPLPRRAWITNKIVTVSPREWAFQATVVGSNTPTPTLTLHLASGTMPVDIPYFDDPSATVTFTISDSAHFAGAWTIGDHVTGGAYSVASNQIILALDVSTTVATDSQATVVVSGANATCVTVGTLVAQTPDPDLVLAATANARPVGCWLTHKYTG